MPQILAIQIIGIGNYKGGELWLEIRREEVDRFKNVGVGDF